MWKKLLARTAAIGAQNTEYRSLMKCRHHALRASDVSDTPVGIFSITFPTVLMVLRCEFVTCLPVSGTGNSWRSVTVAKTAKPPFPSPGEATMFYDGRGAHNNSQIDFSFRTSTRITNFFNGQQILVARRYCGHDALVQQLFPTFLPLAAICCFFSNPLAGRESYEIAGRTDRSTVMPHPFGTCQCCGSIRMVGDGLSESTFMRMLARGVRTMVVHGDCWFCHLFW